MRAGLDRRFISRHQKHSPWPGVTRPSRATDRISAKGTGFPNGSWTLAVLAVLLLSIATQHAHAQTPAGTTSEQVPVKPLEPSEVGKVLRERPMATGDDMWKATIDSKLRHCWRRPANANGPVIVVSWRLNLDGTLDGEPQVTNSGTGAAFTIAAEEAVRAIKTCAPFEFPPDKYDHWRQMSWVFDPAKTL